MFSHPRSLLFFVGILFFGSHMVQANSLSETEEGSAPTESDTTSELLDYETGPSGSGEKPDFLDTDLKDSSSHSKRTSEPVFKCRCWIGWQYDINKKYVDFGDIGLYAQRLFCKNACSKKCAPWLNEKEFLCKKIGENYDSRYQHSVGCFSQFDHPNSQKDIWEVVDAPFELCCETSRGINCAAQNGPGFYYNSCLRLCVKNGKTDCPPDLINNVPLTPHCCDNHKFSICKKPKYEIHSVPCPTPCPTPYPSPCPCKKK